MEDRIQRMKELVSTLRQAGKAYYQESREIMNMTGFMMNFVPWKKRQEPSCQEALPRKWDMRC